MARMSLAILFGFAIIGAAAHYGLHGLATIITGDPLNVLLVTALLIPAYYILYFILEKKNPFGKFNMGVAGLSIGLVIVHYLLHVYVTGLDPQIEILYVTIILFFTYAAAYWIYERFY